VHDGEPLRLTVEGPDASTVTELLTLAATLAVPSAPIVASLLSRFAASRVETPRTTAVVLPARPPRVALAVPTTLMLS
jgi:hypothetical protein